VSEVHCPAPMIQASLFDILGRCECSLNPFSKQLIAELRRIIMLLYFLTCNLFDNTALILLNWCCYKMAPSFFLNCNVLLGK